MKRLLIVVAVFMVAGCGVDWFPENSSTSGSASSPNGFTFTSNTVTQTVASSGAYSQSNVVTITGNNTAGWTVSIINDPSGANSQFSINGGAFTSAGTILPNQTLQVQHIPSTTIGGQVITTIKVGEIQETFLTSTVANP